MVYCYKEREGFSFEKTVELVSKVFKRIDTARNICIKKEKTGEVAKDLKRSGRPQKIKEEKKNIDRGDKEESIPNS